MSNCQQNDLYCFILCGTSNKWKFRKCSSSVKEGRKTEAETHIRVQGVHKDVHTLIPETSTNAIRRVLNGELTLFGYQKHKTAGASTTTPLRSTSDKPELQPVSQIEVCFEVLKPHILPLRFPHSLCLFLSLG